MNKELQTIYPTMQARKERVERFKLYAEQNRKTMRAKRLVANFALKLGLREAIVVGYLRLLINSGIYVKHEFMLLSPSEYEKVQREIELKEKKRKEQLEKEAEARRLEDEEYEQRRKEEIEKLEEFELPEDY